MEVKVPIQEHSIDGKEDLNSNVRYSWIKLISVVVIGLTIVLGLAVFLYIILWSQGSHTSGSGKNSKTATATTTKTPKETTASFNSGKSIIFLMNNDLWASKYGSTPTQFTNTESQVNFFAVDKITGITYYTTFDKNEANPDFQDKNIIYSCSLTESVCTPKIVYSEANNSGISHLKLSPSGNLLVYDITIYVNKANHTFATNMHILNVTTKKVLQYNKDDYPGIGISRYVGADWFSDDILTLNSQVDGSILLYLTFLNQFSYANNNQGDNTIHYYFDFGLYSKALPTPSDPNAPNILSGRVLYINGNTALVYVLKTSSTVAEIANIPLHSLVVSSNNDFDADPIYALVDGSSKKLTFSYTESQQRLEDVFANGKQVDLVICSRTSCGLKVVDSDGSELTSIVAANAEETTIIGNVIIVKYRFNNGLIYESIKNSLPNDSANIIENHFLIDSNNGTVMDPEGDSSGLAFVY